VVAVTALDALAFAALETGPGCRRTIGAFMNAFRGEVFTALYRTQASDDGEEPSVVDPPGVGYPAEVAVRWRALAEPSDLTVVGDSMPAFSESLDGVLGPGVRFQPAPLLAGIVARMARARAVRGGAIAPHAVHPIYLRRPDAEVARERGAGPRAGVAEP
jgi:tRNA A37 threonylcarbamoyladenosine modification protein TsaB